MVRFTLITFCCLLLTACGPFRQHSDNENLPPHLIHHSADTRGEGKFPFFREATGKNVFVFDPNVQAWAAYDERGWRVKTGRASGGADFCPDIGEKCKTVTGQFKVFRKHGADCVSKKFPVGEGGAPMPHCMFFHGGYAIHGSYHVPEYNASHGCIRVLPSAAEWLNEEFLGIGSMVVVNTY